MAGGDVCVDRAAASLRRTEQICPPCSSGSVKMLHQATTKTNSTLRHRDNAEHSRSTDLRSSSFGNYQVGVCLSRDVMTFLYGSGFTELRFNRCAPYFLSGRKNERRDIRHARG